MSLEFNKVAASVLLGGVIAMTSGTVAKVLFDERGEKSRGYQIEVAESSDGKKKEEEINIPLLLSEANIEDGKKVSKKCVACHSFDQGGKNNVGPNLWGILGKDKGSVAGFSYSKTLAEMEGEWGYDELWGFLNNPKKYAKGTKMAFAGLRKPKDLASMIAYLRSQGSSNIALPEVKLPEVEEVVDEVVSEVTENIESAKEEIKATAEENKEKYPTTKHQ